jgi:hypothetical protein
VSYWKGCRVLGFLILHIYLAKMTKRGKIMENEISQDLFKISRASNQYFQEMPCNAIEATAFPAISDNILNFIIVNFVIRNSYFCSEGRFCSLFVLCSQNVLFSTEKNDFVLFLFS